MQNKEITQRKTRRRISLAKELFMETNAELWLVFEKNSGFRDDQK